MLTLENILDLDKISQGYGEWPEAMPLTACMLSITTAQIWIQLKACEKVICYDLGLGDVFSADTPLPSTINSSRLLMILPQYGKENDNKDNFIIPQSYCDLAVVACEHGK